MTRLQLVVRVLRAEFVSQPLLRARFMDLSSRSHFFVHENLVLTRDVGMFPDQDIYFTIRDYVEGVTLQRVLESGLRLAALQVVPMLRQLVKALTPLHRQGACHGGIKPSNIFLCPDGRVLLGEPSLPLHGLGVALDRLSYDFRYAPPEMFCGAGQVGPAADFYALGSVAHEMLWGEPPFVSDNHHELVAKHARDEVHLPLERGAGLGPIGNAVLLRMLAKKPADRGEQLAEMLRSLDVIEHSLRSQGGSPASGFGPLGRQLDLARYPVLQSIVSFGAPGGEPSVVLPPPPDTQETAVPVAADAGATPPGPAQPPPEAPPAEAEDRNRTHEFIAGLTEAQTAPSAEPEVASPPVATASQPPASAPPPTARPVSSWSGMGLEGLDVGSGYTLRQRIGSGGFGEVWRAWPPGGVEVAVKLIYRPIDHETAQRELQALELVKQLRHPFLLPTQAYWQLEDRLLIVMELAESSLRDRLRECQRAGLPGVPLPELLRYFREAAEGLDFLHHKKVLHLDVKPGNILLVARHAKLSDFGLARLAEYQELKISGTGMGTPLYMAPEVWQGSVSAPSDQYALALSYAELRLDRLPLASGNIMHVMFNHLQNQPDLTGLEPAEQQVVGRALAKDPRSRYPTCQAFVQALEQVLANQVAAAPAGNPAWSEEGLADPPSWCEPTVLPDNPAAEPEPDPNADDLSQTLVLSENPFPPGAPPGRAPGSAPAARPSTGPGRQATLSAWWRRIKRLFRSR